MPGFEFSASARRDLNDIVDYTIAQWGVEQADAYVDGLIELLVANPGLGREEPALAPQIRSFRYQSHRLYYHSVSDPLSVIRVLHVRRDPDSLFSDIDA